MYTGLGFLLLACFLLGAESQQIAAPSPVVVSASQFFEGIDGPWSSFALRVGSPAQNVRIFPGTSSTSTLVVLEQGCQAGSVSDCANSRGGIYNSSASSTWSEIGNFSLGFENSLGFTDAGDFGYDTVGLGYQGSGGPTVNHSVIAGIAGTEFYLGMLGLNPRPTNFTTLNNPQPSFLTRLKNDSSIPSLSYSYTAGAPYRLNKALGSLILGGYDTSRFQDTNSSYAFFSDQSRDLTVGLQSITTNISHSDTSLLPSGVISTFIDSSVAEIYLPLDACQAFEKAFNLTYNSTAGLYLVNDTLHQQLLAANPSVTFTIATAITGGPGFNITYPYASFDLQAQPPLLSSSSRYFPLQRATNNTQYTLGRTFLQEAYLVVDYERNNFSVHPCVWNASATPNVVTIPDLSSTTPTASIVARPGTSNHQLSGGAIAGIVIGAIAGVAAIVGLLLWFFVIAPRRQKNKAVELEAPSEISTSPKTDGDHTNVPEIGGDGAHAQEMEGVGKKLQEIEGSSPAAKVGELETPIDAMYAEMSGDQRLAPELASHEIHEMHAEPEIHEMPGSDVRLQEMPETSK